MEYERSSCVASFLGVVHNASAETAVALLNLTDWKLNDAIQLFYLENEAAVAAPSYSSRAPSYSALPAPIRPTLWDSDIARESSHGRSNNVAEQSSGMHRSNNVAEQSSGMHQSMREEDDCEPVPVKEENPYSDDLEPVPVKEENPCEPVRVKGENPYSEEEDPYSNSDNESEESSASDDFYDDALDTSQELTQPHDTLSSMYRPPYSLMYSGSFEEAKTAASIQNRWLIVNLQSNDEFNSHLLNRDTWSNPLVEHIINSIFFFWQAYDDTIEGKKVGAYYNVISLPAVLIIDSITGQKMRAWNGMIQPDVLLEAVTPYMDRGPNEYLYSRPQKHLTETAEAAPNPDESNKDKETEDTKEEDIKQNIQSIADDKHENKFEYLPLTEEPKFNKEIHVRVAVRLPDGRRLQRNFLRSEPVKLLWPFCCLHLEESDAQRSFHFKPLIPAAGSKCLNYEDNLTFDESGLSGSVIILLWN